MRSLKSVYQKQNTLKKFLESEHCFHIATIDGTVALIANFGEFLCFVFCVLCFVFCVLCFVVAYAAKSNQLSFRYFKTSLEIIRVAPMLYVKFPLSLRNVEDLLHERGVDVGYETVRYWRRRFSSQFSCEIKKLFFQRRTAFGTTFPKWHLNKLLIINNLI